MVLSPRRGDQGASRAGGATRLARGEAARGRFGAARAGAGNRRSGRSAALAVAALLAHACADPSEVQALRAKKIALEGERAARQQIAADAALYQGALRKVPEAGMPLDPQEVTARVMKATTGVAVSVERTASGGVDVSLSGPAAPARAAVTLEQLAQYLPDVSLRSVSLRADGFTAKGAAENPAPATAPAARQGASIVPFTEARKLREEVAALEQEVAQVKVGADVVQRGPAALRALQSPDAFRQQAALVQRVVALSTTAELTFEPGKVTARGELLPGRKVLDGLPLFKSDYDVQSMSENAGRFELKLQPRATGR